MKYLPFALGVVVVAVLGYFGWKYYTGQANSVPDAAMPADQSVGSGGGSALPTFTPVSATFNPISIPQDNPYSSAIYSPATATQAPGTQAREHSHTRTRVAHLPGGPSDPVTVTDNATPSHITDTAAVGHRDRTPHDMTHAQTVGRIGQHVASAPLGIGSGETINPGSGVTLSTGQPATHHVAPPPSQGVVGPGVVTQPGDCSICTTVSNFLTGS